MIIREMISFNRSKNPKASLKIGKKTKIVDWLNSMGLYRDDYDFNEDLSINVYYDVNIINKDLSELPEFIKFDRIAGSFYAGENHWESLRGFPNEILKDLQIRNGYRYKKFKKIEINKLINVHGKIWN